MREHKLRALRDQPVGTLELSVRSFTALQDMGHILVGDVERHVMGKMDEDLITKSFGKKCVKEVREILRRLGLNS